MATRIRAIYENGIFRPLDEINLAEGKHVELIIQLVNEKALIRGELKDADYIQWPDPNANPNPEIEAEAEEIFHAYKGDIPLSQLIIEERGEA